MKHYSIQNPNSSAPAEEIDQDAYDAMSKAGRLRGYDVTEVTKPAKPAELTATTEKATPKTPKAE